MRRTFWLALGASLGVVAARRVSKAWRAHAPAQLTHRVGEWTEQQRQTARQFVDAVRTNAAERETQLREAIAQDAPRAPARLTLRLGRRTPSTPAAQPALSDSATGPSADSPRGTFTSTDSPRGTFTSADGSRGAFTSTDIPPNTFSTRSTERMDRRPGL